MAKSFIRFTSVTIPQGATIRKAFVRLTAHDDQTLSGVRVNAYCVDADNPTAPASKVELDGLSLTSAASWDNFPYWGANKLYNSVNITTQLNAVVNRAGWLPGNAVIVVIDDNASADSVHRKFKQGVPTLLASWFSYWKSYNDTYWQSALLDPTDDSVSTSWDGNSWIFNTYSAVDGGRIRTKGQWASGFRPEKMKLIFTKTGAAPDLSVETTNGTLLTYAGYTSGTEITLNWINRGDLLSIAFRVQPGDNAYIDVSDIGFKWLASAAGQTTTTTTSSTTSTSTTVTWTSSSTTTSTTSSSTSTTTSTTTTTTSTSTTSTSTSTMTTYTFNPSSSTTSSTSTTTTTSTKTSTSTSTTSSTTSTTTSTTSTTTSTTVPGATTASTTSSTTSSTTTSSTTSSTTSTTTSTTTTTTVPGTTEITEQVPSGNDDGYTNSFDNSIRLSEAGCSIGNVSGYVYSAFARFTSVAIPVGATIQSAKIQIKSLGNYSNTACNLKLHFEDADNPSAPTTFTDFNSRSLTTGTNWDNVTAFTTGTWYDSPDIKNELQAVVDRGGWASGNAVTVFIKNNASSSSALRNFLAYNNAPSDAPKLVITYTT